MKVKPLVLTLRVVNSNSNEPFVADLIPAGFQPVDHMVNYRYGAPCNIFTTMKMIPNYDYNHAFEKIKICYKVKMLL